MLWWRLLYEKNLLSVALCKIVKSGYNSRVLSNIYLHKCPCPIENREQKSCANHTKSIKDFLSALLRLVSNCCCTIQISKIFNLNMGNRGICITVFKLYQI
ncbi:MAG: hypothetical protein PG981_000368 [Wolbachia endosymbiont of Ctenocephalides orientis wCori]|nr:MAG: hypothetical protein PG981_000368 [Wolbachia endosymbiont of Ctenocephalides orientis wCori]